MTTSGGSLDAAEARRKLYDVMRRDRSFTETAERALEIGEQYFGVANGHITHIDPTTEYWHAVASTDPDDGDFPPGETLDLQSTYCRRTIQQDSPMALHDAPNQGWADDPAYETHDLDCYHGTTLTVDENLYGTVCFVSREPRDQPFSEAETMFADLVARMLGHTLERLQAEARLDARERVNAVLSRVLRHNLRNDLTVVRAHAERLEERLSDSEAASTDAIITTVDELLAISDTARQFEMTMSQETTVRDVGLCPLVERLAAAIESEYPGASVTITDSAAAPVQVSPQLETGMSELLDNAARHAGPGASVHVTIETTDDTILIDVSDDGPGLPTQEQTVLREGAETPLVHGSGLGLWLVYWIVASNGGDVNATVTDTGTTVTIELPRAPQPQTA